MAATATPGKTRELKQTCCCAAAVGAGPPACPRAARVCWALVGPGPGWCAVSVQHGEHYIASSCQARGLGSVRVRVEATKARMGTAACSEMLGILGQCHLLPMITSSRRNSLSQTKKNHFRSRADRQLLHVHRQREEGAERAGGARCA